MTRLTATRIFIVAGERRKRERERERGLDGNDAYLSLIELDQDYPLILYLL